MTGRPLQNAFSVDLEEFFHASALENGVKQVGQQNLQSRVEIGTGRLLELLADAETTATFFVLAKVAKQNPGLVRRIAAEGHEIACHGYSHTVIYEQSRAEFESETRLAKDILEEISGQQVLGYRGASFSVTEKSLWALDILEKLGFRYDSSIFPVRHDRYGIPGAQLEVHSRQLDCGKSLVEVPLSVCEIVGLRVPMSGGGYFRLFPYWLTRWAIEKINRAGRPLVFYIHPWELDPDQPRLPVAGLSRFRHYNNLDQTASRLRRLLSDFSFSSMSSLLLSHGHGWASGQQCESTHTVTLVHGQ